MNRNEMGECPKEMNFFTCTVPFMCMDSISFLRISGCNRNGSFFSSDKFMSSYSTEMKNKSGIFLFCI